MKEHNHWMRKQKTIVIATDTNHHKSIIMKGHTVSPSPRLPSRDEKVPAHSINITTQRLASDSACFGGYDALIESFRMYILGGRLGVCGVWGGRGKCTLEYIYVCMYGI